LANSVKAEGLAPGRLQAAHVGPIPPGRVDHAAAEVATDTDQHPIARLHDVGERRFHGRATRAADGDCVIVVRLPGVTQQFADFVHHPDERRVEMANGRGEHGGENARVAVRRSRPEQNARRHIDRRQVQPMIVIDCEGVYTHVPSAPAGGEKPAEEAFMIASNLLRGELVRLTAVMPGDLSVITRWWSDSGFLRLYNTSPAAPRNEDQLSRRFDLSQTSHDVYLFAVRLLDEDELIGLLEFD